MAPASHAEGGATNPNEFGRTQVTLSNPHPGENAKLHIATQWIEAAERVLAKSKLLEPARGGLPATAEDLVDYPLDLMMRPAAGDQRTQLDWIKLEVHNEKNRKARESALLDAWTQIYLIIEESLQTHAPNLARELRDICDLQKRGAVAKAGYFATGRSPGKSPSPCCPRPTASAPSSTRTSTPPPRRSSCRTR